MKGVKISRKIIISGFNAGEIRNQLIAIDFFIFNCGVNLFKENIYLVKRIDHILV